MPVYNYGHWSAQTSSTVHGVPNDQFWFMRYTADVCVYQPVYRPVYHVCFDPQVRRAGGSVMSLTLPLVTVAGYRNFCKLERKRLLLNTFVYYLMYFLFCFDASYNIFYCTVI